MSETVTITCDVTGETAETKPGVGGPRLPVGWKRTRAGVTYSPAAWKSAYVMRAITLPVAGPVDIGWPELRAILKDCWAQATRASNLIVREMAKADPGRRAEDKKLQPLPKTLAGELYRIVRDREPTIETRAVSCLTNAVAGKYRKERFQTIWMGERSLPSYRWPTPYPVKKEAMRLGWSQDDSQSPLLSVKFAEKWVTLRLRRGAEWGRQIAVFRQIIDGEAEPAQVSLIRQRVSDGNNGRVGVTAREPGGGGKQSFRVMAKIAVWVPVKSDKEKTGVMEVSTGGGAFVTCLVESRSEPWVVHADHIVRWVAEHRAFLSRMSDDRKHELRWPGDVRRRMNQHCDDRTRKQHARIDTFIHQVTAMIAGLAERRRVESVRLDTTDKSYVESFPWSIMETRLAYKLEQVGVRMTRVGKESEEVDTAEEAE